jgi:hypothetical protein
MMLPLFSPGCALVAWLQPGRFVFHADTSYAAFIANGHCWAGHSGLWLGPVVDGHLHDIDGRPVAWSPSAPLSGIARPLRPVNVVRAVRPVRPVRPVDPAPPFSAPMPPGGWSALGFAEWLVAGDPTPVQAEDAAPQSSDLGENAALPNESSEVK